MVKSTDGRAAEGFLDKIQRVLAEDAVDKRIRIAVQCHRVGKTGIVVTHETELVDYFQPRVIRISDGKVVSDGGGGMNI